MKKKKQVQEKIQPALLKSETKYNKKIPYDVLSVLFYTQEGYENNL